MADLDLPTHRAQTTDHEATLLRRAILTLQDLTDGSVNFGGGQLIADTTLVAGTWKTIQVVTDAKFHTLTGNVTGVANATEGSAFTVPAGTKITGAFTGIKLHSGSVIAYT